jgi:siroheme synthase-like protein
LFCNPVFGLASQGRSNRTLEPGLDERCAMYLPLLFKEGFSCLVIGGGKVAARKVETLLEFSCSITVISPDIDDVISDAVSCKSVAWIRRDYAPGDCDGFQLIIAATASREVNSAVSVEARSLRVPVNVVDDPELSTVIFPAVWRAGSLLLAVSTEGVAPFMTVAIRDRLASHASQMGKWVEIGGRFREAVRRSVTTEEQKMRLYARFVDATRPDRFLDPPASAALSDWLSWLDQIERANSHEHLE